MLTDTSGTGKTRIASGVRADAVAKGYKAYFRTLEEILSNVADKIKSIG